MSKKRSKKGVTEHRKKGLPPKKTNWKNGKTPKEISKKAKRSSRVEEDPPKEEKLPTESKKSAQGSNTFEP